MKLLFGSLIDIVSFGFKWGWGYGYGYGDGYGWGSGFGNEEDNSLELLE